MQKGILLIFIAMFNYNHSSGQNNHDKAIFSKKNGVIVFEGKNNVYDMYFIETTSASLIDMLKKKDSVNIMALGSSGDAANNIGGLKWFLDKSVHFDSASLLIADTNHLGYGYEDTAIFYSQYGTIKYVKSKGYRLGKHFKKVYYNNRYILFVSDYFVPIESFKARYLIKKAIK